MKRICTLLCVCSLLLAACGAPPAAADSPLTEWEVLAAYDEAAAVYDWFDLASLPTSGEAVEEAGMAYRAVDREGLSTYADLEAAVRAAFAPDLADAILENSVNYRDIGGKLFCAEGGRGSNLYLLDKTVTAEPADETHWTVTLTFWADSWEWERPGATVGYSQTVLNYEKTEDGWRFADFCPSDGLDLEAETVFAFTYDDDAFASADFDSWSDLQLALYLLHADGAYAEGPEDDLMRRFLDRPADILSLWDQLHADWQARIFDGIGYAAAAWLDPEGLSAFSSLLTNVQPETDGGTAALGRVRAAFEAGCAQAAEDLNYQLFSLVVGEKVLHLGDQAGDFPWSYDLREVSRETLPPGDGSDRSHTVDCGSVTVHYLEKAEGEASYIFRITTDAPGVKTFLGVSVGDTEEDVKSAYPGAVYWGPLGGDSGWSDDGSAWVCEPGGNAWCKHVAFYMKDGRVNHIEIEDLMDGRLLS